MNLDRRCDVRVYLDDSLIDALARHLSIDRDLAAIHVDVLLLQCLCDILARHRAKETPVLADAYGDLHRDLFELRGHELCLVDLHRILARLCARLCLCHVHIRRIRGQCELPRQEKITSVAVRYLHDLALFSDILYISLQYDFHVGHSPLYMPLLFLPPVRAPRPRGRP